MVFATLLLGVGLSPAERTRATRLVSTTLLVTSIEQTTLVDEAGWELTEHVDVTEEYAKTARRDLHAYKSRAGKLKKLLGERELEERLTWRCEYIQAIEGGLLRRELFVARVRD